MRIDRCICTRRTFSDLRAQAVAAEWDCDELMRETTAGRNCTMCAPYVRRACRTGQVVFHEILTPADEAGPGAAPGASDATGSAGESA